MFSLLEMNGNMAKTLVFLPETGIYPYFRTLITCGSCVSAGGDLLVTHCTGQMECCPMLAAHGKSVSIPPSEKHELCCQCNRLFHSARKKYHFTSIELSEIITERDKANLRGLIPHDIKDCYDFSYLGFSVGKIAVYDLVLDTKILDIHALSEFHEQVYRGYILNTMIALTIAESICISFKPNLLLTFNPYSQCQAAKYIAENHHVFYKCLTNVPFMGADYSQYLITSDFLGIDMFKVCQEWDVYSHKAIFHKYVEASWSDSLYRFYGIGSHIFFINKEKTPEQVLKELDLKKRKKTLVAFTSSNDEFIGMELFAEAWGISLPKEDVFGSTVKWIRFLYDYSTRNLDVQIVVRVHPREGRRQKGVPSEHLLLLQREFPNRTDNFVIVWPDDPISSYDLIELADIVLVTLSTMGQESARVGIPIISCSGGRYYSNHSFMRLANNISEYENALNAMLTRPYTFEMLRDAIRFNFWRNYILSVDFCETVPREFNNPSIWPDPPQGIRQDFCDICFDKITVKDYNLNKWEEQLDNQSELMEKESICDGIACFINYIMQKKEKPARLVVLLLKILRKFLFIITGRKKLLNIDTMLSHIYIISNPKLIPRFSVEKNCSEAYIWSEVTNEICYSFQGHTKRRYSPLLYRLLKLYKAEMNE